ncbi:uncharacterized protein LY89DRAFT_689486 [Mollisia scopiformis]|uniref:Uncharacterized protein n=1 Tax=Mollisia scopiformis TaxID=149040 RepID=A0A194WSM6_MOLSC|nr:uncharacterized protein LY89DRAFT_689486 [Mollisia scopiformis]KUJ10946.1 hypothetical protein LY89DRAFT_689486 [Mollisia scopiformis]
MSGTIDHSVSTLIAPLLSTQDLSTSVSLIFCLILLWGVSLRAKAWYGAIKMVCQLLSISIPGQLNLQLQVGLLFSREKADSLYH